MNQSNIVVVGGGFAGWLTSLYAKKAFPHNNVTVIESQSIGILGAGEGSVPYLVGLLQFLDVPLADLISKCKSTVKNGIKFEGWSEKNYQYFHAFDPSNRNAPLSQSDYINNPYLQPKMFSLYLENMMRKANPDEFNFMAKLSYKSRVPFLLKPTNFEDPIMNLGELSYWSIHFDAVLIAEYMKSLATSRGVALIDGKVSSFSSDPAGNITAINLEGGYSVDTDFIFDCSGLHRLIVGKHLNSEWDSYSSFLPVNKAIPFFIHDEEPVPYTSAIAMDFGWMWKIPLQHRTGAGYVFDSTMVSEDDAKSELDRRMGYEVDSPRTIDFNAGAYKEIWINNVLAIGLSGGFIEPLEASSIWMFSRNLERFFSDKSNLLRPTDFSRQRFNEAAKREADQIRDFIYLHYVNDKAHTPFWKDFVENNPAPDFIAQVLETVQHRPPYESEINDRMYWDSYYQIIFGNNMYNQEAFYRFYIDNYNGGDLPHAYDQILARQRSAVLPALTVKEFTKLMNSGAP